MARIILLALCLFVTGCRAATSHATLSYERTLPDGSTARAQWVVASR